MKRLCRTSIFNFQIYIWDKFNKRDYTNEDFDKKHKDFLNKDLYIRTKIFIQASRQDFLNDKKYLDANLAIRLDKEDIKTASYGKVKFETAPFEYFRCIVTDMDVRQNILYLYDYSNLHNDNDFRYLVIHGVIKQDSLKSLLSKFSRIQDYTIQGVELYENWYDYDDYCFHQYFNKYNKKNIKKELDYLYNSLQERTKKDSTAYVSEDDLVSLVRKCCVPSTILDTYYLVSPRHTSAYQQIMNVWDEYYIQGKVRKIENKDMTYYFCNVKKE